MLREAARVLAEDLRKRVVIVDTSNEIAGDGDIPHPGIGRARRMQVPRPSEQHAVMIEAVENHMPEVIVIDEIGTELEALAARTIAERGVQLIGTAHGNTLDNLLVNPTLSDLVGGIQAVTLGDEEARRRGTQKTVLERKAPPTFDVLVEIQSWDRVPVYGDVASAVDSILRGEEPRAEQRAASTPDGQIRIEAANGYGRETRQRRTAGSARAEPARGRTSAARAGAAVISRAAPAPQVAGMSGTAAADLSLRCRPRPARTRDRQPACAGDDRARYERCDDGNDTQELLSPGVAARAPSRRSRRADFTSNTKI